MLIRHSARLIPNYINTNFVIFTLPFIAKGHSYCASRRVIMYQISYACIKIEREFELLCCMLVGTIEEIIKIIHKTHL